MPAAGFDLTSTPDGPTGRVDVDGSNLTITVPDLLEEPWRIPLTSIVRIGESAVPAHESTTPAVAPRLPLVTPDGETRQANVVLVFTRPRRFPPFGPGLGGSLPFAAKRANAGEVWVEGVELAAEDADTASQVLAEFGIGAPDTLGAALIKTYGTVDQPTVSTRQNTRRAEPTLAGSGVFWYTEAPVLRDSPVKAGTPATPKTSRRSVAAAIVAGSVAAVVAAVAWAMLTYATGSEWRVAAVGAGLIVGYAFRRCAPAAPIGVGLGLAAGVLGFASVALGWLLTDVAEIAHVNHLSFMTAWQNIGDTTGGWNDALPFHQILGWAFLGLASVTAFYIARLPQGAEGMALAGLSSMPGAPNVEPMYPLPRSDGPPATDDAGSTNSGS